ncbi:MULTISPECIES: GGDEF domain-containing protein [Candidatus Brocadia]|uniref:diguanylate cyclase n=1 Tax=Candidatus Brocadia sinica JPN1 TaxID=1197129 RepID=A0ABQ0JWA7_9BACT|nr:MULTISPECIES: diguanylate cyclase [Brocadia]GAN33001.1 protein contains FOG: GGDEF domain [Candidatus Brocadia sinica JPN1]GIK14615.1 MAG: hypothetical protein BroJett002_33220 [Candidatus Brocadia sinica]GJQ16302.1 MAG: hypothetical protein HBSIN01_02610 [Candidatus Brocadia sinica]
MAEKLRDSIAIHAFADNNKKYHVTASFGVAEINPAVDTFTKDDLLNFADEALFESKKKGRNSVTLHTSKKKWFGRKYIDVFQE